MENCTPGTGATIEALRIAAGLTIKDIEFHTKFSYQIINAIEKDDFGTLPASIYVRGFKNFFKFLAMGTQRSFIDAYTERQPVQSIETFESEVEILEAGQRIDQWLASKL